MTLDPNAAFLEAVEAMEQRVRSIKKDLEALRGSSDAVNAEAEISLSLDDIEAGWDDAKRIAHIVAETSPHLAHGFLSAHLRCLDGWFGAGRLLSRSEVVSRRFGPKAHAAARAAKSRKNAPVYQAEAEIISQELEKLRVKAPGISAYSAAPLILDAVNARLRGLVIEGRPLTPRSFNTIARRIIDFSL